MRKAALAAVFSLFGGAVALASACVERDRLCVSTIECGTASACVAGRCQAMLKDDAGRTLPPEIASPEVRRVVVSPTDIAYVSAHGGDAPSALPPVLVLGRAGDAAALLLRFAVPIAPQESVVEAYVLLDRADVVESDPFPISLHAARILDAWDGRSISYARAPRWEETGSPGAIVTGSGKPLVRIDVRDLVSHWKERDPRDQGIVIVSDKTSRTGMAFAAASSVLDQGPTSMLGASPDEGNAPARWAAAPPRLELYLRTGPREAHVNLPVPVASNAVTDGGKPDSGTHH
ncbi:MAG TPA: DNRLRE domain-containing protein [Polyangiaceae bacterium]|jgi:hypothetical protein